MVYFNCDGCGESLKKNQVDKHRQRCRNCHMLTCLDCNKDFRGNDYEQHTKCVSEEERYSGKGYKPKPNANKGEIKQELWTQQVQDAIVKAKGNRRICGLLEQLKNYSNIPRKKAKFENFLKSSFHVYDNHLATDVWTAISAEFTKSQEASNTNNTTQSNNTSPVQTPEPPADDDTHRLTGHKHDAANNDQCSANDALQNGAEHGKKKKKKHGTVEMVQEGKTSVEEVTDCVDGETTSKKSKKKKKHGSTEMVQEGKTSVEEVTDCVDGETTSKKSKKKKKKHGTVEMVEEGKTSVEEVTDCVDGETTGKKCKKRKHGSIEMVENGSNSVDEQNECVDGGKKSKKNKKRELEQVDEDEGVVKKLKLADSSPEEFMMKHKGSFKWEAAIVGVLKQAPDNEMNLKKLRKKVLSEFNARSGDGKVYTQEKLFAKLAHKLSHSSRLKVIKDRIKLIS